LPIGHIGVPGICRSLANLPGTLARAAWFLHSWRCRPVRSVFQCRELRWDIEPLEIGLSILQIKYLEAYWFRGRAANPWSRPYFASCALVSWSP